MASLTETYADKIVGALSCFDRVIITGSLVHIAYAEAMVRTLRISGVRLLDYTQFTEPLRDEVRANAERLAAESRLTIEYVAKKNFRKEERVTAILKKRGDRTGLVHLFSAMESCPSFRHAPPFTPSRPRTWPRSWDESSTRASPGEAGNDFHTRLEGTRVRHYLGPAALKMYDRHGSVLRIETTVNDVTFFKHHRRVEHRDGTRSMDLASVRRTIYSLGVMAELLHAANRRYLQFLSGLDLPGVGIGQVEKVARAVRKDDHHNPGFNPFHGGDLDLFPALVRGELTVSGFRNRHLQPLLDKTGGQVSRLLKRLRLHGIVKRIGRTYKYYLTTLGQAVIACALRLRDAVVLPALAGLSQP